MKKAIADIVKDVRACIDEADVNVAEFVGGTDSSDMDNIIKSKICDAMRFVYANADVSMLTPTWEDGTAIKGGNNMAYIPLEDKVLRICYAKLDGWSFPCTDAILYTDKGYAALKNSITTGYPDNPKMAISMNGKARVLEMYGVTDNRMEYSLGYMEEPKMNEGEMDIPEKVYRGVVYYTAGLTLLTYKDAHADNLMNQAIANIK